MALNRPAPMPHDEIIVAVFPSRRVLLAALDYIKEDAADDIRQAAVIAKSKTGEILVLDDSLGTGEGGLVGGTVGGLIMAVGVAGLGALTLPAVNTFLVIALGLLIGGLVGWFVGQFVARMLRDTFAAEIVDALAAKLNNGQPALMLRAVDAARLLPRLRRELKQADIVDLLPDLN
ncbi:MAG: hypothetical protein AAF125_09525 [Chloroflexota bacterium]